MHNNRPARAVASAFLSARAAPPPLAFARPLRASRGPQALLAFVFVALTLSAQPGPRPSRIVSLIPAVTEMLFAIGAGPQVAAVGSFDRYPPEVARLPRVGALLDPDLEKILSLRPDLVAVYGSQTDLRQQLERARVPVFTYRHAGLGDVTATMRQLGEQTGRQREAGRAVAAVEEALEEVRRRVAGRARPRVLLVFGREAGALRGIYASGGIGFLHDLLDLAGGVNVFADVQRESVQASTELVLARRPDVIVELRASSVDAQAARTLVAEWKVVGSVPAIRDGRIHIIADDRTFVPGPRVAESARLIARALHAEAFR